MKKMCENTRLVSEAGTQKKGKFGKTDHVGCRISHMRLNSPAAACINGGLLPINPQPALTLVLFSGPKGVEGAPQQEA
jgi:hypothetical protein